MLRSLYAGVSGMRVHQVKMDVIGNNIANVNTVGFKSSNMSFKEMLSQTMRAASEPNAGRGGLNPMQIGLGVQIGSIDADFSQGNLQATGKMTDIAIQGNGFFVLNDGARNVFSRAGVFTFDEAGNMIHRTSGLRVQGWMADENGRLPNMNPSTMENLSLGETTMAPTATTTVQYKGNLNAIKDIVDLSYGPEKITISDSSGNMAALYITSTRTGLNTPDRADDRWTWSAKTDIPVRGEALNGVAVGSAISLARTNPPVAPELNKTFDSINKGTVIVTNAAGTTTYVEGTDYDIDYDLGTITILGAPGSIAAGDNLLIDYDSKEEIAIGEVTVDDIGAVRTSSVTYPALGGTFQIELRDSAGALTPSVITLNAPEVGKPNGGGFALGPNQAGINFRPIDGEYGPVMTTAQTVYDSKGSKYMLNVSFIRTGENRWDWYATGPLDADGNELPLTNNSGTIFFDAYGKIMGNPTGGPISFQPSGSERVTIMPDFTAMSQFDDADSASIQYADGYEAGSLQAFSIDGMGTVIGSYSNGLTKQIAKIAVANFTNAAGLVREGDTIFTESNNSGTPDYGLAGTGGKGVLSAGTLEMSNVDLADQFTEMITTQRGFQASSKIIQTADQILQDLVQLKR